MNKVLTSEVKDRITTVDELLEIYNISLDDWEIVKKVVNTWESTVKGPDKQPKTIPNFQVKVWLESKKEKIVLSKFKEELMEDLKKHSPKVKKKRYSQISKNSGKLLEVNIFDLHLGKVSWSEESGENYNVNMACEIFKDAVTFFVNRAQKDYLVERIVFPVGNDFFNSDSSHPYSKTTKGTPQQDDTRWQKIYRTGREILVDAIERMSEVAPVDVLIIPGNHDTERAFYIGDSLECWFHNNENVTVDNSASPRKYYKFGNVLLGFTHGNEEKITDLPGIMSQEVPEWWGETYFREFHLGHLHQKSSRVFLPNKEVQGTIVRHMSSLSATDAWHHKKGYVGARKSGEALVWDKKMGLFSNYYFNILPKDYT